MSPSDDVAGDGRDGPGSGSGPSAPLSPAARWRAFGVCVLVAIFTMLDLSKVNVALPSMEAAFGTGSTEMQLIVAGYILTFGLTLVPAGRLGDQRSRRALFVVGLVAFTLASLACALAPTSEVLLIGRLVQGLAAGIQMPQVIGLIQELFQGAERGRAFGMFGAATGIATAFGPTLGGLLIAAGGPVDGWRWVFGVNVPLGAIAVVLVLRLLPRTRGDARRAPLALDPLGVLLFAAAVILLLWPLLFTTGSPDDDPARWWALAGLLPVLALFVLWERHYTASGRAPLIDLALLRIPSFRDSTIIMSTCFGAVPAMFVVTTLYLQRGLGLDALFAGMVTIGFALVSSASSWFAGRHVTRRGRLLVVLGLIVLVVNLAGLILTAKLVPPEATLGVMAVMMAIGGIGGGAVMTANQTLSLKDIPVAQAGVAGSIGQLGQRIGNAIGASMVLALFYSTIYRESGTLPEAVVFQDAYAAAMSVAGGMVVIALVLAVVDLVKSRARP